MSGSQGEDNVPNIKWFVVHDSNAATRFKEWVYYQFLAKKWGNDKNTGTKVRRHFVVHLNVILKFLSLFLQSSQLFQLA